MWQCFHNACGTYTSTGYTYCISQALSCILHIGYPATATKRTKIEIQSLSINVNTINTTVELPMCTSIQDIQEAAAQDVHLQDLKTYISHGCQHKEDDITPDMQKYWPIRHELAMIGEMDVKGKRIIIIPSQLQMQILSQLHSNHMVIKKRLLVHKSVY